MANGKPKTRKSTRTRRKPAVKSRRSRLPFFRRGRWMFAIRFVLAFVLAIFLIPAFLLMVYRIEFVRPVSTLIIMESLAGNGAKREWVEFEDISPTLYQSVLMSEDGQFCSHNGIDWDALNQVIDDAIGGERTRGASTITMQLVKNLFLWPERSFVRKGLEIPYALMAETVLGKRRIMEIYLNIGWCLSLNFLERVCVE